MTDNAAPDDQQPLMDRYPPHKREGFPSMTKRVYLPILGQEVVVGRLSVQAYMADARMYVLSIPAMREAAQAYAAEVAEKVDDGTPKLPKSDLPPEVTLEIQREGQRAIARAALLRPPLEVLVEAYGGDLNAPDFGIAEDFEILMLNIVEFVKVGGAEKEQTKSVAVPARGIAEQFGRKVGKPRQ